MFKISFFVPEEALELVKNAMFEAGAGRIGNYEKCSFEVLGTGQFRAMKGATPFIGEVGKLHKVRELKVEMVCEDNYIRDVIGAMKKSHPYEMPAYDVISILDL